MKKRYDSREESKEGKFNGTSNKTRSSRRSSNKSGKRTGRYNKEEEAKVKSTNDPAWYSANPDLLRDAASIPFSWPTGTLIKAGKAVADDAVPGVLSIECIPSIGNSMTENDPVNVASNAIYTFVRHANSGHSNYDAPDLMMYLLAMSHIYSFVTWCQRLLGIVGMFDQRNRYMPQALIAANWVDYNSLRDNIAKFRFWLNNYITKVASLAVPATMNIFNRLAFMYSNIYIDGPSVKDQMYVYVPSPRYCWMRFHLNDTDQSGELIWVQPNRSVGNNYSNVDDIMNYGTALFNAIWEQEDFGIMSGDILKAYGDNIIKLAPVPVDFALTPIYDAMVLHQMKNATLLMPTISKVTQSNGIISQLIMVDDTLDTTLQRTEKEYLLLNKVLSSDFEAPTPEVVIESTRLMAAYDDYTNYIKTGTEIAATMRIWYVANDRSLKYATYNWNMFTYVPGTAMSQDVYPILFERLGQLKHFKYAPEIYILGANGQLFEGKSYRVWDIDNYAVLSSEDIAKMHEAAIMSLFAVPAIAKIS